MSNFFSRVKFVAGIFIPYSTCSSPTAANPGLPTYEVVVHHLNAQAARFTPESLSCSFSIHIKKFRAVFRLFYSGRFRNTRKLLTRYVLKKKLVSTHIHKERGGNLQSTATVSRLFLILSAVVRHSRFVISN